MFEITPEPIEGTLTTFQVSVRPSSPTQLQIPYELLKLQDKPTKNLSGENQMASYKIIIVMIRLGVIIICNIPYFFTVMWK